MRRLLLLSIALSAGCNSILDIPERSLLEEEDTGASADVRPDFSIVEDSAIDTAMVDSTFADTENDSGDETANETGGDTSDSSLADTRDAPGDSTTDSKGDTAVADTSDAAPPDTAIPDTAPGDTGVDAATCGVAGMPCCGAVAATCNTNAACGAGTCVAAAGACVRASDCSGACVGPTLCAGKVCFACGTAAGTGTLGSSCTESSQCATGPCDRSRGRCTTACANAITGDADCTALPKGTCVSANSSVTSGGTTYMGKVGYCARGCSRDNDCLAGDHCRAFGNDVADRVDLVCAPPRTGSTADPGTTCAMDSDCKGGYCQASLSGARCAPYCETAADCPSTLPKCTTVTFTRPVSMMGQTARACTN